MVSAAAKKKIQTIINENPVGKLASLCHTLGGRGLTGETDSCLQ